MKIKISGKVQGVFFRASAKDKARELEVRGFVCNEPDGSVYVEAEGEEEALNQFVAWCYKGPAGARVGNLTVIDGVLENHGHFEIRKK